MLVVGYGPAAIEAVLTGIAGELTVPVQDVVRVHDDRWWSLTCPNPGCCPPGAPVAVPEHVRLALLVAAGAPAATRSDRSRELGPAPRALLDQVAAALAVRCGSQAVPDPGSQYALLAAARQPHTDHRTGTGTGTGAGAGLLGAGQAAALLAGLSDVRVRDACILWDDQAEETMNLWRDLVRLAPPGWVAPAATLLALAAYRRGDGVLAHLAIDRALDDDPGYRLAGMVREALRLGLPPDRLAADLQEMAGEVLSRLTPSDTNPPTVDTGLTGDVGAAGTTGIAGEEIIRGDDIDDRRM